MDLESSVASTYGLSAACRYQSIFHSLDTGAIDSVWCLALTLFVWPSPRNDTLLIVECTQFVEVSIDTRAQTSQFPIHVDIAAIRVLGTV